LGDKLLAQMFYNTNLLTIINLILEGDKHIMKKKEKKLSDMFRLNGSNLFMIPCEVKNESFGELFKRMITKNGILCIALYRKNLVDNFYYVYTNPRKTTLIKETDFIFILAGTASIDKYYEHYESNIDNKKEKESEFNKGERKEEKKKPAFFQMLQESIKKQYLLLRKNKIDIDNSVNIKEKSLNLNSIILNNINSMNEDETFKENQIKPNQNKRHSILFNYSNIENSKSQKNYKEIEELQQQVNKTMDKLKQLNIDKNEFEEDINSHIKNEVRNELLVYLNKIK